MKARTPAPTPASSNTGWRVTPGDRAALLRKYRTLAVWRRARDRDASDGPGATRGGLKALAEEFPGALRELDLLGLREIERRVEQLEDSGSARGAEPWMAWILSYHAIMRAALAIKRSLAGARAPDASTLRALASHASAIAGVPLDEAFVRDVARPPNGRIAIVVLTVQATFFKVARARIGAILFPPRRARPYALEPP